MTETVDTARGEVNAGTDAAAWAPASTDASGEGDGPPKPLIGLAAGVVLGSAVAAALLVRRRRQEQARAAMARERIRRAALFAGGQIAMLAIRVGPELGRALAARRAQAAPIADRALALRR